MILRTPRSTHFPNTTLFRSAIARVRKRRAGRGGGFRDDRRRADRERRSEEQTSELQSHLNLVCRLLLEKKKLALLPFLLSCLILLDLVASLPLYKIRFLLIV